MTKKEMKKFLLVCGVFLTNSTDQSQRRLQWHWTRAWNKIHRKKKS